MQHARHGRNGLLQEGSPAREPYAGSFDRAVVLRSELFAEWDHRLERISASASINKPSHSDSSIGCPTASYTTALIASFKLGREPSSIFQSRLHSTPRTSDLETPRPQCVFSSLFAQLGTAKLRVF